MCSHELTITGLHFTPQASPGPGSPGRFSGTLIEKEYVFASFDTKRSVLAKVVGHIATNLIEISYEYFTRAGAIGWADDTLVFHSLNKSGSTSVTDT